MTSAGQYKPGDIVNGHRLNEDGTAWVPVPPPPPAAQAEPTVIQVVQQSYLYRAEIVISAHGAFKSGGEALWTDREVNDVLDKWVRDGWTLHSASLSGKNLLLVFQRPLQ